MASFAIARLAQDLLPDAPVWDVRLIGVAGIIMFAVAAAAFVPARRASAADPMVVLRND